MDESRLKKKTISSVLWKLFEQVGVKLVVLIVQLIMARMLTPEYFGALAIMLVIINLSNVIVQSGLNVSLVQMPSIEEEDYSTVFWLSFTISIVLYSLIYFSAPLIASFYSIGYIAFPIRILSLLILISPFNSVQIAIVQRNLEFRKISVSNLVAVLISGIFGVVLALFGGGLWALVVQSLGNIALSCIILGLKVRWRPRLIYSSRRAKILFCFGWKILVGNLLGTLYDSASDLIIGKQFNAMQLGYVSQGKKFPVVLSNILDGSIQPVMLSAVSRVQGNDNHVKRLMRRAITTSSFVVVPCTMCLFVIAKPLVILLLGQKWIPAVPFLQMFCVFYIFLPIGTVNLQALNGVGRSDIYLKLEIIKKAYGIALLCLGAFVFGDIYILVGLMVFSSIINAFVNASPSAKILDYSFKEQLQDVSPYILISGFVATVTSLIDLVDSSMIMTLVIQVSFFVTMYILLAKVFKLEAAEYLANIVNVIRIEE